MSTEQQGIVDCRVCRQPTLHTTIRPVSRGMTYIRCSRCGTVRHFATPVPERPS